MKTNQKKNTKEGTLQPDTFKGWGKEKAPGYETNGENVEAIWYKLYIKHIDKMNADNKFKTEKQKKTRKSRWITRASLALHFVLDGPQGSCSIAPCMFTCSNEIILYMLGVEILACFLASDFNYMD